mgnify:CR=1 FL=1
MTYNFPPLHDVVVKPFDVTYNCLECKGVVIRVTIEDFPQLAAAVIKYWQDKGHGHSGGTLNANASTVLGEHLAWAEIYTAVDDADTWMELRLKSKNWSEPSLNAFS